VTWPLGSGNIMVWVPAVPQRICSTLPRPWTLAMRQAQFWSALEPSHCGVEWVMSKEKMSNARTVVG
jgi:hypothetical protein